MKEDNVSLSTAASRATANAKKQALAEFELLKPGRYTELWSANRVSWGLPPVVPTNLSLKQRVLEQENEIACLKALLNEII